MPVRSQGLNKLIIHTPEPKQHLTTYGK